ncbi:MAG: tRNA (N(6)-L-threonylcarbamoyladenosine(37)-C(2))-methylthiotransferase MtaB [Planctomycetota bacterium]|nr:tRNA (N(6)-L-threonylcarbamoyladenosine(37)-C(2))-methylthiotransferase MtaB [Planctomycetota bacterium]
MSEATLRTVTLGCKVNQYETELVREGLLAAGYVDAATDETADLCIVNTCTVTAEGDSKSRQTIRRLARRNPAARIVVMGCYATRAPDEIAALPGVVEVVTDKRELPDLMGRFGVVDIPTGVSGLSGRHRGYVKVQDGCLLRCNFCIIPKVRPTMYSRPMAEIIEEVRRLVGNGYREIVLTGIHLGHYGVDFNRRLPKSQWTRLSHLVQRVAALPGDFRVRLSSIEATEVTRELIDVMAGHSGRVCPHLHVSMQSGSDAVLRRMRRRWGSRRYIDRCRLVQERLDHPAITTDIIVGFPGETDGQFEETCQVAREVGFSKIHIFPFSPRRGTPAADFDDQLPKHVKQQRARQLAEVEAELRDRYFESLLGRRLQVLVEGPSKVENGGMTGTACRYAPVELVGDRYTAGSFAEVEAGRTAGGRLFG